MRRTASAIVAGVLVLAAGSRAGQAQTSQAPISLRGRIVAADTGLPLRSARVQPTVVNRTIRPAFTDADGGFAFAVDRAARVTVTKSGYLPASIAVPRTDADVEFPLTKASVISGRITDTQGDPVIGMAVTADVRGAAGSQPRTMATAQTDDRGEYRLAGLPAGGYFVSVHSTARLAEQVNPQVIAEIRTGRRGTDEQRQQLDTRAYYPGVQTIVDAEPITLTAGEERTMADFLTPALTPFDMQGGVGSVVMPRGAGGNITLPVPATDTAIIRGHVITTDGRPVARAIVRLDAAAPGRVPPAVTDAQGRYQFQRLGAVTSAVVAQKPGFITMAFGQRQPADAPDPVQLQGGENRAGVDIVLPRPGAVTGRVVDEGGEPVEDADVHVLQAQYREGRRQLVDVSGEGTHRSDDRGMYRIYGLTPGEYYISTTGDFSTVYYPGTVSPGGAQRLTVDVAQDTSAGDLAVEHLSGAMVSGTVVDANGRPFRDDLVLTRSRRSGVLATEPVTARIDPDGRFAFTHVVPGEYVLQASTGGDPNNEGDSLSTFLVVGNSDIAGLDMRLSRGSTVGGRVSFEGNWTPDMYFTLNIQAIPTDKDRTPQNLEAPASARIQPDGTFEMAGLSGPRVFRLGAESSDWTVRAVYLNGRDVTDTPLVFGTQPVDGLEIVLTDRVSTVTGHAVDASGRGVADATVILFPTDPALWGDGSRFLASVRTGKDGAFSVKGVPPGDFRAAAVARLAPGEWRDPDLLAALLPSAASLTIAGSDTVTATLPVLTKGK